MEGQNPTPDDDPDNGPLFYEGGHTIECQLLGEKKIIANGRPKKRLTFRCCCGHNGQKEMEEEHELTCQFVNNGKVKCQCLPRVQQEHQLRRVTDEQINPLPPRPVPFQRMGFGG